MPASRPRALPLLVAAALVGALVPLAAAAPGAVAAQPTPERASLPSALSDAALPGAALPPVIVTEILADTRGVDEFEYVEIRNTTDAALDLAAAGISFAYMYADGEDRSRDVALATEPLVLAPQQTALLWVSYTTSTLDAFRRSAQEFRAFHGVAADVPVVRLTGQPGIANGGDRGIRVLQGDAVVSSSFAPAGAFAADLAAHFRIGAVDPRTDVFGVKAQPSPGIVLPEALVRPGGTVDPEPEPQPGPAASWPLIVTEIAPDGVGVDDYEYFEVHNPTSAPIDLAAEGFSFAYIYGDTDDRAKDVALTVAEPVTIPADGTVVFWLSYTDGNVDAFARTVEQFRATWNVPAATPVVRVTGQNGMANAAPRGIRVLQGETAVSRSVYGRTTAAPGKTTHFRIPGDVADTAMVVLSEATEPSPGVVAPEALQAPAPEPEPEFDPQPDPTVTTAPLQITELLPDSTNVGGSDGYEFVEVYNATSAPIDFSDYTLEYVYPVEGTLSRWPAVPADVVIPGGETLVLWVRNGANDHLSAADFNAQFGTALVAGENLVDVFSAGMANGSPRGMRVVTNTGHVISSATYNMDGVDETQPDQGIRYTTSADDLTVQRVLGLVPATPGTVQADQVPGGLMIVPADTVAPSVEDRTASEIAPGADFPLTLAVSDDARTVVLELANSADEDAVAHNLVDAGDGTYTLVVNAADLIGKRWFEYRVTATDGTNTTRTDVRRIAVAGAPTEPVRLNVDEGQYVAGTTEVVASGDHYPSRIELEIDGESVETEPTLAAQPVFVFEATNVNYYFKNGVRVGEDVLHIFDKGTVGWETITVPVPLQYFARGEDATVSVWAGTKKAPEIDPDENNDDFEIRGLRMILPDGRTLTPAGYDDPSAVLRMGDSAGKLDYFDARFAVPENAFSAVGHAWDTTIGADRAVAITAADGDDSVTRTVTVDNTAPEVASQIVDGTAYKGEIVIDAAVTDAGSGVAETSATLDGVAIPLPYTTSSVALAAGDHALAVTAADAVGNRTTWEATFTTYAEQPSAGALAPAEGAEVRADEVTLQAKVEDPTGDVLDVQFLQGRRLDLADGDIEVRSGTVNDARSLERPAAEPLSAEQLRTFAAVDGVSEDVSSAAEFPHQLFDVEVGEDAAAGAQVRTTWSGRANADATVILYAQRADGSGWDEVDRHVAAADDEAFALDGAVPVGTHARDGVVRMLVQHSEGFAGEDLSERTTPVTPHNPADVPRLDYDFTFGWESDTQYYNENGAEVPGGDVPGKFEHQRKIHDFLLDRRDELNLQYLFHTGDIVDDFDREYQWRDNADPQYARLDQAGLPYGVLAGNHDVGHDKEDYSAYGRWFGEDRFSGNPWYGGSFENNRGHYDLISAGGIDFLMLYVGWLPNDASIAWMNEVLAQYPDRVAIIAQHEFILTTGGLGEIPQRVLDEVVAPNPNVRMVLSGHYHDAFLRTDAFDDTGDGVADRTVYSMLFDYQGLPEGGLGFLRLLHFDNDGQRMMVRTYSPSLDVYNSDEPSLLGPGGAGDYSQQEFELTYAQLGIAPTVRTLGTDAFTAELLDDTPIASFPQQQSGTILAATWRNPPLGEQGWYVRTSDAFGGVDYSRVSLFTVLPALEPDPGTGGPGTGGPGTGGPGTGGPGTGGPGTGLPGGGDPIVGGPGAGADGAASGTGGVRGDLATTGSDASAYVPWAFGAGGLMLVGGLLLLVRRRARS